MKKSFYQILLKVTDIILMLTLAIFIITMITTLGTGWDTVFGKTDTKEILVDYSFVRLEGKPTNRSLAIKEYGLSCVQDGENLCNTDIHGNNIYAQNVQFILVNNKYSFLKYGEFTSKKGSFTIDNSKDLDLEIKQFANNRISYIFVLLKISLFLLFIFLILKLLIHKLGE